MNPRSTLGAFAVLALAATALLLTLHGPAAAPGDRDRPLRATNLTPPATSEVATPNAVVSIDAGPRRTAASAATTPPPEPLAHVTGRCVDAAGVPLAGCRIDLQSQRSDSPRAVTWRLEHKEPPPWLQPEPVVTGDDGRFAFAFWPPPSLGFVLDIAMQGRGELRAEWEELDAGQSEDLGDVVLHAGVRVRGRVIDEDDNPIAEAAVRFTSTGRGPASHRLARPDDFTIEHTAGDGTFTSQRWLPADTYRLRVPGHTLTSAETVDLLAERPEEQLTIVVTNAAETRIAGRVIDEAGAPVADVGVFETSGSAAQYTAADGSFVLTAAGAIEQPTTQLTVRSTACQPLEPPKPAKWGDRDVVVRVRRVAPLQLRVTDEAGAPVTRYAVRMMQTDATVHYVTDEDVRTEGEHPDGVAMLPGLFRGNWLLVVEFAASSGLQTITTQQQIGDVAPGRLDLVAHATASRTLRVLDSAGAPVVGTTVRLCDLFGKPLDQLFSLSSNDEWLRVLRMTTARLLQQVTTGDDGSTELHGPGDHTLCLLIGGEGDHLLWHGDVRLDTADELVVQLQRGAGLKGRCMPAAGLAKLGLPFDAERGVQRPKLVLLRGDRETFPHHLLTPARSTPLTIADDGTFAAQGIPAGTWRIAVRIDDEHSLSLQQTILTEVTLVDGQTLVLDLDLTPLLPGTLNARVLHNGTPLTGDWIMCDAGQQVTRLDIDAGGRCSGELLPGTYRFDLRWSGLLSTNTAVVRAGEETEVEVQFFSGKVTLQLLDPDGAAVANVPVFAQDQPRPLGTTNASGQLLVVRTPSILQLSVLPRRLGTPEDVQRIWREGHARGDGDPYRTLLLPLGEVTLQANDDKPVELRLPEAWRQ
ncbi:MAG: carboxypeptidase regulatory-like domain-containing protein [Planctomycetes bacterium]|nr:carboxypeptidase regulatory-like domain-containing protein [Planctomycetota bacterium]